MKGTYVNSHEQCTLQIQGPRNSPGVSFHAPTVSLVFFSSQPIVSRCFLIVHVMSTTAAP